MAQFHVNDAFAINDRTVFVLAGFVIEGEVAARMHLRLPLNASAAMTAEIDHIQSLRRPDGEVTCLCIRCKEPNEITLWSALHLKDRTIEIIR